ncbi:hypothetical protein DQP55_12315 [Mycolicibacterium sp. GF69]|uniref:hypothetical protein n=1 Tax=Mycolicibacterium sp. GF69 TaxID=2267251 RepID=UPI000DCB8BA7|nr:hypothetical protein [Mycolicibacterium sp. GF69]RAV12401.1 hypothetical protein DQP55_12315 [Mycolicibacterium sp. GF69]
MTTAAASESADTDNDDICCDPYEEGCTASLTDGEGWNGSCGNCADRQYAEEEGDWWLDEDDTDVPPASAESAR